jgi:hypothetical protein
MDSGPAGPIGVNLLERAEMSFSRGHAPVRIPNQASVDEVVSVNVETYDGVSSNLSAQVRIKVLDS